MTAIHSKVKTGGLVGGGGVALGPLVAYLLEWWGAPPMGDAVSMAAGGALVWVMNNLAGWMQPETVHGAHPTARNSDRGGPRS